MGLLDGQRIAVTGGGSGIGAAVAERVVNHGGQVAVLDKNADAARAVAAAVGGLAVEVDVADTDAMDGALRDVVAGLGGLTGLCNNAGIGHLKPFDAYTGAEFDRLIATNLKGVFNGIRAATAHLRHNGGGAIVNMASVSGLRPTRGEAPYAAAKAGVIALTQSAALELGPDGIRVNCVSPGFIRTPLTAFALDAEDLRDSIVAGTPLRRPGEPGEIADVVVFLCSPLASYLTGQNLVVDGGSLLPSAQVDHLLTTLLRSMGE
jgi:NAD(P)-dependent dehydrogenase (short-subunit alcohol dehydrogenase family)